MDKWVSERVNTREELNIILQYHDIISNNSSSNNRKMFLSFNQRQARKKATWNIHMVQRNNQQSTIDNNKFKSIIKKSTIKLEAWAQVWLWLIEFDLQASFWYYSCSRDFERTGSWQVLVRPWAWGIQFHCYVGRMMVLYIIHRYIE